MNLLSNEQELVRSNADKIILTDRRIHLTDRVWGKSYQITIFLEDISSIENTYKSNMLLLTLAVISGIIALITMGNERVPQIMMGSVVLAGIFLILWAYSREHLVTITSTGGQSLNFQVQNMGEQQVQDFIHKVQQAKLNRISQLYKI